ncbi:hypothetical protein FF80_01482 [Devosia sp. LC5]|uniref:hypothetical protein n=1 Tax=Devosia sp. LC5 TaxID=1502724 RepID=UPI0004E3CC2C|nr:hypothetical protein [Devosia sp. LC5]KFC69214.1 hypothetical protein FF80_01482 [Devosia sp. LC5]
MIIQRFILLVVLLVVGAFVFVLISHTPPVPPKPSNQVLADHLISVINENGDFSAGTIVVIDATEKVCPGLQKQELDALLQRPGWQFTAHYDNWDGHTYWFKKTAFWWTDRKGLQIGLKSGGCYAFVRRADAIR